MTDEERARLAEILEQVSEDGLHHPRDLDAALDAIDDEWKAALAAERERCAAAVDVLIRDIQTDMEKSDSDELAALENIELGAASAANAIRALGDER